MMRYPVCLAAIALIGSGVPAFVPSTAHAQTLPDIQDLVIQGEQVNRNAEAARAPTLPYAAVDDGAVDGEAGIYVLTFNKIFQVSAGAAIGYTDNPTRTSADTGGSFFADFSAGAGVATRIDDKIDLGASLSMNAREFFKDYGPSSRSVSGAVSAGTGIVGPLYLGVAGFGGFSYDGAFEHGVSFYGLSATLSALLPVTPRLAVRPGVGAVRQWSGIDENRNTSLSGSIDASYAFSPTVSLLARGVISVRWYDDFYEDVTFVSRRDTLYGVSATLGWRPSEAFSLSASIAYDNQESRLFLSDFDALELGLAITARYRF
ncbi:MAG: hypothetical protein ABW039_11560 [Sphingobium sp.]